MHQNDRLHFYHYDGHGSVTGLSDETETLTDTYTYEAWGTVLARTGTTENRYQYTGEQYDPNLGFTYLRARYYNPTLGRFHTLDTWQGNPADPITLHKYLYANANPVMNWDPSGEFSLIRISVALKALDITFSIATYAFHIASGNYVGLAKDVATDAAFFFFPGGSSAKNFSKLGSFFTRAKPFKWGLPHSSRVLAWNLEKIGLAKFLGARAHHIVPGGEKFAEAIRARQILKNYRIDINSFVNGVWLSKKAHSGRHTKAYSIYVYNLLKDAAPKGREAVYSVLEKLRLELQAGQLDHLL